MTTRRTSWRGAAAACLAATSLVLGGCGEESAPRASAETPGPYSAARPEFVGLVASEVLPQPAERQRRTMAQQAEAGSGLLRQTFQWNEIEPRAGDFAFGMHDGLVAAAAAARIRILPIVFNVRPGQGAAPKRGANVTDTTTMPPKDPAVFAAYAARLVQRYGRGGSFWAEHPELPRMEMTSWQIWNEPNLPAYWGGSPNAAEYTRLLRAAGDAILAVDPKAEIVSGGIPKSKLGVPIARYLRRMAAAGARGHFDTLAIHPYATDVDGVMAGTQAARDALDANGMQDVDLWITEAGWATGGPRSRFTVSPQRQAELVGELVTRAAAVAQELRLRGVVYYGWRDVRPYPGGKDFWGLHTGLLDLQNRPKPAVAALRRASERVGAATSAAPAG